MILNFLKSLLGRFVINKVFYVVFEQFEFNNNNTIYATTNTMPVDVRISDSVSASMYVKVNIMEWQQYLIPNHIVVKQQNIRW